MKYYYSFIYKILNSNKGINDTDDFYYLIRTRKGKDYLFSKKDIDDAVKRATRNIEDIEGIHFITKNNIKYFLSGFLVSSMTSFLLYFFVL